MSILWPDGKITGLEGREPLRSYQYEAVHRILTDGPLAAWELACMPPFRRMTEHNAAPAQAVANMLRPLVARGWLCQKDPATGVYDVTPRARASLCW